MAAGAVIGALRANLSLESASFTRSANNAKKNLRELRAQFVAVTGAVAALGTGLLALARDSMGVIDAQAKLAQSLGTTVESIQVLQRAGDLAGVSMSGIEQATKDLTRRLSQAAAGTGPAVDALERLGLSASGLMALPLDERVAAINSAILEFVPAAERAAVAGQLFGEEGSIAMSRIDTATLRQATQDVRDFGVAVSEADADQIEAANDAISRIGLVWRGVSNQLAVELAPTLQRLADAFAEMAREGGVVHRAIQLLVGGLERLAFYAGAAVAVVGVRYVAAATAAALSTMTWSKALLFLRGALIRTGIGALIVGLGEATYQFSRLREATGNAGEAFGMLLDLGRGAVNALIGVFFHLGNRIVGVFRGTFGAIVETFRALPAFFRSIAETAMNGMVGAFEAVLNRLVDRYNNFIAEVNAGIEQLPWWLGGGRENVISFMPRVDFSGVGTSAQEELRGAGRRIREAFVEGLNSETVEAPRLFDVPTVREQWRRIQDVISRSEGSREATEALEDLRGALEDVATMPEAEAGGQTPADAVEELSDAAKRAQSAMATLRDGMAEVFSSVLRGASSAREAVGRLLDRLADMAAQNAFKALFNNTFGNGLGAGGQPTPFGNILGFLFGGIDAFANGGRSMGGLAMVGERGPDLVNLPRGSYVSTAAETARMLDGVGGPQEVHVFVHPSGEFDTRVQGTAARVVEAGIREYDRSGVSRRIAAYQADPRARR